MGGEDDGDGGCRKRHGQRWDGRGLRRRYSKGSRSDGQERRRLHEIGWQDKGFAEISNKQGRFIDRDLYLTATRLDGAVMAHGANEKLIGKSLIELKDIEGKEFIREMVETAKTKSGYWIDYKFTNPVSKKVEPKSMYCERFEDIAVCGGIYKK